MSNPIILIVIDIISQILFNSLVKSFYLSIGLKIKDYRKFVVYFEFYNKCYKESRSKSRTSICHELVRQSIVVNNLPDNDIYKILC